MNYNKKTVMDVDVAGKKVLKAPCGGCFLLDNGSQNQGSEQWHRTTWK